MAQYVDQQVEELRELSITEMEQVQGGSDEVDYTLTVTDTEAQTSGGTLIPVKVKHNV